MILQLTIDQTAQVASAAKPGHVLLGRVLREPYDGSNAETAGRLSFELGYVPAKAVPALREAIRKTVATKGAKRQTKRITAAEPQTTKTT